MAVKVIELLQEEREKYPEFTEWQLYARVRARIMSEYGLTETALQLHKQLDFMERNIQSF